jgi:nucleoside-diphosphate-sugar epimerase
MKTKDFERVLVTDGVGFIGSHLVDNIITQDTHVTVFGNLTSGTLQNIKQWLDNPNLTFIKGKLLNPADLKKLKHTQHKIIFHLTANSEVRLSSTNPEVYFQQNSVATHNF